MQKQHEVEQLTLTSGNPEDLKPGTLVNFSNGYRRPILEIKGTEATFGPAEPHPAVNDARKRLKHAAAVGGAWAFLDLIVALVILTNYAPNMTILEVFQLLYREFPAFINIASGRYNAGLPFEGELPFGIPVPQKTETTTIKRDEAGLIAETEKRYGL